MAADVKMRLTLDNQSKVQLEQLGKDYGGTLAGMADATRRAEDDIRREFAKTHEMLDRTNAKLKSMSYDRVLGGYRDSAGRLRDEFGRFMTDAQIRANAASFAFGAMGQRIQQMSGSLVSTFTAARAELARLSPMITATLGISGLFGFTALSRGVVNARMELERYNTEFEVLFKSKERANAAMNMVVEFAAKTPFQLPEVIQATRMLETLTRGALSNEAGLRIVGDAASATGLRINELAMWFGRLYDGIQSGRPVGEATMRLQELGIMSGDVRNRIEVMQKTGKSGADVWKMVADSFGRYAGMMEQKSKTLEGKISNIQDVWWRMKTVVADKVFPELKRTADQVLESMETMLKDGTAEKIGEGFASAFNVIKSGIQFIQENWHTIRDLGTVATTAYAISKGVALITNPLTKAIALTTLFIKAWRDFGFGDLTSVIFRGFEKLAITIEKLRLNVVYLVEKIRQIKGLFTGEETATQLAGNVQKAQDRVNELQMLKGAGYVDPAVLQGAKIQLAAAKKALAERLGKGEEVVPTTGEELARQAEANVKFFKDRLTGVATTQADVMKWMEETAGGAMAAVGNAVKKLDNDITAPAASAADKLKAMLPFARSKESKPVYEAAGAYRMPTAQLIGEETRGYFGVADTAAATESSQQFFRVMFRSGIEGAMQDSYDRGTLVQQLGRDLAASFHEGFSSTLQALMKGGGTVHDALKSFADDMSGLMNRFVADTMTTQVDNQMKKLSSKLGEGGAGIVAGAMQALSGILQGGPAAGSNVGSGLGMIAGTLIGGPVGTILGGLAGGLLGGLFDRDDKTREDISRTADNTAEMAQQLEVVNRNLIGLRNQMEVYPLPSSAYFSRNRTTEQLALESAMALA